MTTKTLVKSLANKSTKELQELLESYQKEYYTLRVKNKLKSLTQTHLIKQKRRDIARIKTVLHTKRSS